MNIDDDGRPILLVEDNPNDVLLIRRAFKKAGIENPLTVLTDGDQAIRYLAHEGEYADPEQSPAPAVILLDLKLPRRSGHEVLAWLKSRPVLRRTPVVVLTSSAQRQDVNQCYDVGANSYLVKPVQFDDLLRLVDLLKQYWVVANEVP